MKQKYLPPNYIAGIPAKHPNRSKQYEPSGTAHVLCQHSSVNTKLHSNKGALTLRKGKGFIRLLPHQTKTTEDTPTTAKKLLYQKEENNVSLVRVLQLNNDSVYLPSLTHYCSGPNSQTEYMTELIMSFPLNYHSLVIY